MNYRGQSQAVSEEYCNQFGNTQMNECIYAGCAADTFNMPQWTFIGELECLLRFGEVAQCTASPDGYFIANSIYHAQTLCGDTKMAIESESFCFKQMYRCITPPPGNECKESWQSGLSKMIPFDFAQGWGCETKAYLAIGVIIFAVMMVL